MHCSQNRDSFCDGQVDINTEVGVVYDVRLQELRLYTDYGRCCRPLFIVENQTLRVTKHHIQQLNNREETKFGWSELVKQGFVEWVPSSLHIYVECGLLADQLLCGIARSLADQIRQPAS